MKRILVVEDDKDINEMIAFHLGAAGYEVEQAYDGEKALALIERCVSVYFDLFVLDVLLPGMDGWELCRKVRESGNGEHVPVIFLSALSSEDDRIKGFDLGCDDYLVKPFSPRELVSRVKAIFRRSDKAKKPAQIVKLGKIAIDYLKHRVEVAGEPVHLTGTEFQILNVLATNEERVFSREELLGMMRKNDFDLELGNIDVHVHRLRQKIEDNPKNPRMIQTVWGVGYRFMRSALTVNGFEKNI